MQNFKKTESRPLIAFESILEDIPGGVTVAVADLTQLAVLEGTPIGKDANGLYHVVKTAKLTADAANTDTAYKVAKGHNLKVGDFFAAKTGAKSYAITAIDTSDAGFDTVTVGTTLGLALTTGAIMIQAAAESAGTASAFKYDPIGLVGTSFDVVVSNNHLTSCVVRGSVREANIVPISADIKAKLPLIRFV